MGTFTNLYHKINPSARPVKAAKPKPEQLTITKLGYETLQSVAGKEVFFKGTKYKVKRLETLAGPLFQLINIKYNNIEISGPFKR